MLTLFDPPSPTPTTQRGFTLRDFQSIDADEVERQWNSRELRVLLVHATGLGKSLMAAELAARKPSGTRALIIVDSTDLAKELYRTVYKHVGRKPGILTGDYKEDYGGADIVIATKQCLCAEITRCHELANDAGAVQRYKTFDLATIDRIIVDECEAALADEYVSMMVHFIEHKPDLKILGMTATPLPSANRSIADLFSYAASEPGPLYRDLQWAYLNGWLTKPMQGSGGKVLGIMRRYNIPVAENGGCKLTMKGSAHGLYIPRDWWRGYGPVLVVEGGSDTAAALTLGLSAIGRPSNIGGVNLLIGLLGSCERPIIVLGERDRKPDRVGTRKQCHANCDGCSWCYPGRYGARVTAERLRAATGFKRIIWRMPPAGVKDLRAWVQSEHEPTAAKLLNRLEMV